MSKPMTLEEIEALAKDATPGPWAQNVFRVESEKDHGWANDGWILSESPGPQGMENAAYIAQLPRLLKIAQDMRAEMEAKDRRIERLMSDLYRLNA